MSKIKSIKAEEILNSKGEPTVLVELKTDKGVFKASVPAGTSTGILEAVELRDGGERYRGRGVLKAVRNVNEVIAPELLGKDACSQERIDRIMTELDGTDNKAELGANAILPVSIAVCRAGAEERPLFKYISKLTGIKPSLPKPSVLIIEGGKHAGNFLDFQEFMAVPQGGSFSENLRQASEVYFNLKDILIKKYSRLAVNTGLEGGFAPPLKDIKEALSLITEAVEDKNIKIAIDSAATSFYKEGVYIINKVAFTQKGLLGFYSDICRNFPLVSIEDPFHQDDWEGFSKITKKLGKKIDIVGDDLLVTNSERIKMAEEKRACTAVIIKPNQIGTVTETIEAAKLARSLDWKTVVSHRSGDTVDTFISDLAAGLGSDFIKAGGPVRGERVAKYNRLLEIEREI